MALEQQRPEQLAPLAVPTVESERLLVGSMAELVPRQVLLEQQAQMVQEP